MAESHEMTQIRSLRSDRSEQVKPNVWVEFILGKPLISEGKRVTHGENGGTLGMVPLIINPIYTPYIVGIYWDLLGISPFKGTTMNYQFLWKGEM